jgi:hypothetical protein
MLVFSLIFCEPIHLLEATSRSVASMSASISTDRSTICGAVTASPRLMLA